MDCRELLCFYTDQTGRLNIAVDEAGIIVDLMTGVQLADKLKSEGNLRMKEKDYAAASAAYTSAYRYI